MGSSPIHSITQWHSLFLSSFTRSPIGSPYELLSQEMGGLRAYRVSGKQQQWVRFRLYTDDFRGYATPLLKESSPSHCLLAQAYQCFWLVPYHDASNSDSHLLTLPLILAPYPPSTGRYYVLSRVHSA